MKCFLIFFLILFFSLATAQTKSFCTELNDIRSVVERQHYQPKPLNDSLSKSVFSLFINKIDEDGVFFLQEDIESFKNDEFQLDDYIQNKECDFINAYADRFLLRMNGIKNTLEDLKSKALDYSGKDSLYFDPDRNMVFFKTTQDQNNYWQRRVKHKILTKIIEEDSIYENLVANFKSLEKEIKPKVIDNELCVLQEKENQYTSISTYVQSQFYQAYLGYQDPNSMYFSTTEKQTYENRLSNSQISFGIYTTKTPNGEIMISFIAPGSSAFKDDNINEDDIILSLKSKNDELELYCVSNQSVIDFLNDNNHPEMEFRLKKQNGQVKTVLLKKSKITNEENSITGYVLQKDVKVGYISIPSFYTDLESYTGIGVADDVAKQVFKLQREGVQALILDLRDNGGGSMSQAIDLSGMFIDRGPVTISSQRDEENYTIRDPNRGILFSKPIIVLVNQFSASASELFASVLQDYNSAIIVGSTTHGKSTSQVILPLSSSEDTNFVKLTTGKFFRVTGNSVQNNGVVPDLFLPSYYDGIKTREADRPYSILNSTTEVTLSHRPKFKKDFTVLKEKSAQRIGSNTDFNFIKDINKVVLSEYVNKKGSAPITLKYVFEESQSNKLMWNKLENLASDDSSEIEVLNTSTTKEILSYNTEDEILNIQLRKQMANDPYLIEAYYIAKDFLKL